MKQKACRRDEPLTDSPIVENDDALPTPKEYRGYADRLFDAIVKLFRRMPELRRSTVKELFTAGHTELSDVGPTTLAQRTWAFAGALRATDPAI
jgi:hypothetical protein